MCLCRCLLAKTYNAAEQLLEDDVLDVDPNKTCCTPTDLYLYSLYGSMICIGGYLVGRLCTYVWAVLAKVCDTVLLSAAWVQVASSGHVHWSSCC
jgi:hypothetical protein